jgi:hypothetical protein
MNNLSIQKRIELRIVALDERKAEYSELWDSWKVVESKAQPIAAVAGIFLAGVFGYLVQLPITASKWERGILLLIATLLVGCVVTGLMAIWVSSVSSPYISSEDVDEVDDQLREAANDGELDERHERMIQSATNRWKLACGKIRTALERKKNLLSACLTFLCFAGGATLPLVYWTLFQRTP